MTIRLVKIHDIPFEDSRLGRHIAHDPMSWDYQEKLPKLSQSQFKDVQHRRWDPTPEPIQRIGCCTAVAECMMGNAKDNRVHGEILDMDVAVQMYSLATVLDPFPGKYPPTDTGSSGLSAAKAACKMGLAVRYDWYFTMQDLLVALQLHPISFGGNWYYDMFNATYDKPLVKPTGAVAGGHQWVLSGYRANDRLIVGECWWGKTFGRNGRFYIAEDDFRKMFEARGDAHWTWRKL